MKRISESELSKICGGLICPEDRAIADAQLAADEKECDKIAGESYYRGLREGEAEVQKAREEERKKIGSALETTILNLYDLEEPPDVLEDFVDSLKSGEEVK